MANRLISYTAIDRDRKNNQFHLLSCGICQTHHINQFLHSKEVLKKYSPTIYINYFPLSTIFLIVFSNISDEQHFLCEPQSQPKKIVSSF